MSSDQRWKINDALRALLQLSRLCCLAPVRFLEINTDTFIYISRSLLIFNIIIGSIMQLCTFNFLYLTICSTEKENYRHLFLGVFNVGVVMVFIIYAVLYSETRIKNYMTCLTKLKQALRILQNTEEYNFRKWHVLIMFITLTIGTTSITIFTSFVYNGSIDPLSYVIILEFAMTVVVQQQFLYFSLYVSFVLTNIKQELQEELSKIISDKNGKSLGNYTPAGYNIPIKSINKAIDMIGMTDILFPDLLTTQKQKIAQRIQQINDSYLLACEVLRELSSSDDFLLFLQLISLSFHLVFSSYDVIILFHIDGSFVAAKLILQTFVIFLIAIRLIMIVEPCHGAHEMILNIRYLVSEIMCHVTAKNDPVFKIMEGFYHHLVLNDISYTALGICKIGRPLVTSILGVAITVLIAIFQV